MIERETLWRDDAGNVMQIAVAWLSDAWDPLGEVTEQVGPFDDLSLWRAHCVRVLGELGVGQMTLDMPG